MNQRLTIASYTYEHTAALFDGRVTVAGVDAAFQTAPTVTDIFQRMVEGDFDISELGLTYFLRMMDSADTPRDAPFLALPIFLNRNFRHSAIYVNTAAGIEKPQDLVGKTIGEFALYGHDAGVWPKGILADEYGVRPDECSWVIGGTNFSLPSLEWIPQPLPAGVQVRHAGPGQALGAMLESGEIDALISVDVPRGLLDGSAPSIARLFPNYEAVERDYYRRTGIFPPMHIVAVRRELTSLTKVLRAVYAAFEDSKDLAERSYRNDAVKQHMSLVTPWFSQLFEDNRRLLGEDWWPYGVSANLKAIDTFLRYHYEQGLSKRLLTSKDIFVPEFLDT